MDVRFGVHTGLQHTSHRRAAATLWRAHRGARLRLDLDLGPLLRGRRDRRPALPRGDHRAHRARVSTTERVTCGSLVYSAGYRHPAVLANAMATLDQVARRPHRARARRRLAAERVRRVRHALRQRRANACACSSEYVQCVRGLLTQERTTFAGEFFHAHRRAVRTEAGAGAAADLDRRRRREGDAAHRRAVRRRLERAVHRARRVGAQGRRARRALRRRRPRSRRRSRSRSTSAWRSPTRS